MEVTIVVETYRYRGRAASVPDAAWTYFDAYSDTGAITVFCSMTGVQQSDTVIDGWDEDFHFWYNVISGGVMYGDL
jgi:hypothetical protein